MNDSYKKMSVATTKQAYELVRDVDHLNKLPHHYDACVASSPPSPISMQRSYMGM